VKVSSPRFSSAGQVLQEVRNATHADWGVRGARAFGAGRPCRRRHGVGRERQVRSRHFLSLSPRVSLPPTLPPHSLPVSASACISPPHTPSPLPPCVCIHVYLSLTGRIHTRLPFHSLHIVYLHLSSGRGASLVVLSYCFSDVFVFTVKLPSLFFFFLLLFCSALQEPPATHPLTPLPYKNHQRPAH
jgi:hypothetical protein